MKTRLFGISVFFILAIFCISCEKDNGGSNGFLSFLDYPSAYTIKSLKLEKICMTDPLGETWNTGLFGGSNPDIYFKIQDINSNTLYVSNTITNVGTSNFPVFWNSVNVTLDIDKEYLIRFYDQDGNLDADDFMVGCKWRLSESDSRNSSYVWENKEINIRFVVELKWLYD